MTNHLALDPVQFIREVLTAVSDLIEREREFRRGTPVVDGQSSPEIAVTQRLHRRQHRAQVNAVCPRLIRHACGPPPAVALILRSSFSQWKIE